MIHIRNFKDGDEDELWDVFYSSIHQVCSNNYTLEQLDAWAPKSLDPKLWVSKIRSIKPIIAIKDNKVVGYADLQEDGLIDHFFVHGNYQSLGVGSRLMKEILKLGNAKTRLYSEVSHTAKAFFLRYGFEILKVQHVTMHGVSLTNNLMERRIIL